MEHHDPAGGEQRIKIVDVAADRLVGMVAVDQHEFRRRVALKHPVQHRCGIMGFHLQMDRVVAEMTHHLGELRHDVRFDSDSLERETLALQCHAYFEECATGKGADFYEPDRQMTDRQQVPRHVVHLEPLVCRHERRDPMENRIVLRELGDHLCRNRRIGRELSLPAQHDAVFEGVGRKHFPSRALEVLQLVHPVAAVVDDKGASFGKLSVKQVHHLGESQLAYRLGRMDHRHHAEPVSAMLLFLQQSVQLLHRIPHADGGEGGCVFPQYG